MDNVIVWKGIMRMKKMNVKNVSISVTNVKNLIYAQNVISTIQDN